MNFEQYRMRIKCHGKDVIVRTSTLGDINKFFEDNDWAADSFKETRTNVDVYEVDRDTDEAIARFDLMEIIVVNNLNRQEIKKVSPVPEANLKYRD